MALTRGQSVNWPRWARTTIPRSKVEASTGAVRAQTSHNSRADARFARENHASRHLTTGEFPRADWPINWPTQRAATDARVPAAYRFRRATGSQAHDHQLKWKFKQRAHPTVSQARVEAALIQAWARRRRTLRKTRITACSGLRPSWNSSTRMSTRRSLFRYSRTTGPSILRVLRLILTLRLPLRMT